MMRLDLATAEYIGARAQQQDLAAAVPMQTGALLVLADGLGGHESGADASRIVVETFKEACATGRFNTPDARRQALRDTIERANARIAEGVDPAHGHRGMASTVVAAVISHGELQWVSVGDSHLYLWRGGRLHKLNEDHSQAGLMIKSGQYKPGDPEVQAVKSVLVSALTGRKLEIVDLPQKGFKIELGDVFMLASDGLNTLEDDEIASIVAEMRGQGSVRLSTVLLERVRSRRVERQDNTTVAIARIVEALPQRVEPVEPRKAVPVSEPARPLSDQQRRPVAEAPVIDPSDVRTERVTPAPAPAAPERIANTEQSTSPIVNGAAASPVPPVKPSLRPQPQAEPQPVAAAAEAPAAPAKSAEPQPPQEPARPAPVAPVNAEARPVSTEPTPPQVQAPSKPSPAANGARVSQPRQPVAPSPRAAAEASPRAELPGADAPILAAPELDLKPPRRGISRAVLTVLLLWLIAAVVAIAAVATLKPEWLNGLVPGFGIGSEEAGRTQPATGEREEQKSQPATAPAQAPAQVPAPVPAVRPPADQNRGALPEDQRAAPGSSQAQPRGPAQPQAKEDAARASSASDQAGDQAQTPASSTSAASGQTDSKDVAAPQSATPLATDPPLVEPQRPVSRSFSPQATRQQQQQQQLQQLPQQQQRRPPPPQPRQPGQQPSGN